ncbi:MAG: diacylglycerol/lipid kinase family protein [Butyrivibrio sp.]
MKKLLFVYNPHSGKALIKNKLMEIIDIFTRNGYEVTAYPTQHALDGYDKVCDADGKYDVIVCSGGDGTLNEVISAAVRHRISKPVIGYIPAGSTNDFANTLQIPKNMVKAAMQVATGVPFTCDLGKMNGRYFNYIAAFGVFTDVSYNTPQNMKNLLGHQAYILESLKSLSKIKAYHLNVYCNGLTLKGSYIYGGVSNSDYVAGIKGVAGPDVSLNDGLFEVILVKEPTNALELQQIVAGVFSKNQESPMVERFKTNRIVIESEQEIAWTVDGENGDSHQRVEIVVARNAVNIIVDPKKLCIEDKQSDQMMLE